VLLRNAQLGDTRVDLNLSGGVIRSIVQHDPHATNLSGEVVDAHGHWLTPGLWDNHVHFSQWTLAKRRPDISATKSAAEAARVSAEAMRAEQMPALPFVAVGFRDGLWADAPNLADLDAAAGEWPMVLVSADLHSVWLNSAALALYGHAGHPTGLLREDDAFEITRRIDDVPDETLDSWADQVAAQASARGVVGIVDFEMTWNLDTWLRRMRGGTQRLRVEFGIYSADLDRAIELGLRTGDSVTDLLTVGSFKVLTDGSLNTRTAYCYEGYGDEHGHGTGVLTVPPEELMPLLRKATAAGILPAVHAIGDRANTLALDVFEELGVGGRIEHAQLLATSDVARFAQLNVVASVQPEHAMDDRDVADKFWQGRTDRAFVLRSLVDAGAELAFGSDAPVAPLDPWITMAAAVGRGRDNRPSWHPEQCVTVAEAIAASTRTTIAVGQPADLVLTTLNPATASVAELRAMPVVATLLAGKFTFRQSGFGE
jgi:hypothetical protein